MPAVHSRAALTAEVPDRRPPNLYEMYTSIATLNAPIDISIVQRVWICQRDEWLVDWLELKSAFNTI